MIQVQGRALKEGVDGRLGKKSGGGKGGGERVD